MAPASVDGATTRHERWRVCSYVLARGDFNDIRVRLPRSVRRDIRVAPEGHVGLIAQAIVGDEGNLPLAVLYDSAPASVATESMRKLERRLAGMLT